MSIFVDIPPPCRKATFHEHNKEPSQLKDSLVDTEVKECHKQKLWSSVVRMVLVFFVTAIAFATMTYNLKDKPGKNVWWPFLYPSGEYDWCPGFDNETAPFHEYLPCSSTDLLDEAYGTEFIQRMKRGTLNPTNYSRYDLQDWVYLQAGANLYGRVCEVHPCNEELTEFFSHESSSFQELADGYSGSYLVGSNVDKVVDVAAATKAYTDYENRTSVQYPAQYTAVIMAPCLQTWAMLAERLYDEGAVKEGNAYNFWIENNRGYVSERLNAVLDNPAYGYDKALALGIYREGVRLEIGMFKIAS